MQNNNKRERILDAMQELMRIASAQAISVSDIAQKSRNRERKYLLLFFL